MHMVTQMARVLCYLMYEHDSLVISVCTIAYTRWHSWLRYCTTSQKVMGSIPDGVSGIFQ